MISPPKTEKMPLYKKICRPKKWRAEINNIKQPCWCGEEWSENHEDSNHGPVLVPISE
jgi:hypothetical protein